MKPNHHFLLKTALVLIFVGNSITNLTLLLKLRSDLNCHLKKKKNTWPIYFTQLCTCISNVFMSDQKAEHRAFLLGLFSLILDLHSLPETNLSSLSLGLILSNFTIKQGSSENDGRSDVYDHSEFKVISNWCYTNCCRNNCGHFTCIYLNFTWIYLYLPKFT